MRIADEELARDITHKLRVYDDDDDDDFAVELIRGARSAVKKARARALRFGERSNPRYSSPACGPLASAESEDQVARAPHDMADATRQHWISMFQDDGDEEQPLETEAERWAARWDFSMMEARTKRSVKAMLHRARRTTPEPDGTPYTMWRNAGEIGLETCPCPSMGLRAAWMCRRD